MAMLPQLSNCRSAYSTPLTKFRATRNAETSDQECACSIVSSALGRVGIRLSERRIAEIWAKISDRFGA